MEFWLQLYVLQDRHQIAKTALLMLLMTNVHHVAVS